MTKIITVHAFRNGVGRSTLIVNLAALLAARGLRVGVVETNVGMPSLRILFGLGNEANFHSLNAYLDGECTLEQAICHITPHVGNNLSGEVFLIPANSSPSDTTLQMPNCHNKRQLHLGIDKFSQACTLDMLFIDPPAGLAQDTLECLSLAQIGLLLMRPDRQDYQGTGFLLDIFRKVDALQTMLFVNNVPTQLDFRQIRMDMQQQYECPVTAVIPHSSDILELGRKGIFVLRYPKDPFTELYQQITNTLMV